VDALDITEINGNPMDTETVVTLELRLPGHVVIEPGQRVMAPVSWGDWCGPAAVRPSTGEVARRVSRNHGRETACPGCDRTQPTNTTASWFNLID
jgi:hypothetical protein